MRKYSLSRDACVLFWELTHSKVFLAHFTLNNASEWNNSARACVCELGRNGTTHVNENRWNKIMFWLSFYTEQIQVIIEKIQLLAFLVGINAFSLCLSLSVCSWCPSLNRSFSMCVLSCISFHFMRSFSAVASINRFYFSIFFVIIDLIAYGENKYIKICVSDRFKSGQNQNCMVTCPSVSCFNCIVLNWIGNLKKQNYAFSQPNLYLPLSLPRFMAVAILWLMHTFTETLFHILSVTISPVSFTWNSHGVLTHFKIFRNLFRMCHFLMDFVFTYN